MSKTEKKNNAKDTLTLKKNKKIPAHRIREKAFENYINRGRIPGYELEDWIRAEKQLKVSRR